MIKKIFNPGNYPLKIDYILVLLRLVLGSFMLAHGWGKFLKLIGNEPIEFADPIGLGATA